MIYNGMNILPCFKNISSVVDLLQFLNWLHFNGQHNSDYSFDGITIIGNCFKGSSVPDNWVINCTTKISWPNRITVKVNIIDSSHIIRIMVGIIIIENLIKDSYIIILISKAEFQDPVDSRSNELDINLHFLDYFSYHAFRIRYRKYKSRKLLEGIWEIIIFNINLYNHFIVSDNKTPLLNFEEL